MKNRIDKFLVEQGFVDSRIKAQKLIDQGYVLCNGRVIKKLSEQVDESSKIEILQNEMFKYVSRGGFKLERALNSFNISLQDKVVMDIGSSTGGFSDCAIQNGAKKVVAIDVGTDLMDKKLRDNPKIELYEKTDIRTVSNELFSNIDFIVTDVSFISLKKILDKIVDTGIKVEFVALIKPQFECGKDIAQKYKGVILNKQVHKSILIDLILYFNSKGFFIKGLDISPIKGGDGNIEYLCYSSNKEVENKRFDIEKLVATAFLK